MSVNFDNVVTEFVTRYDGLGQEEVGHEFRISLMQLALARRYVSQDHQREIVYKLNSKIYTLEKYVEKSRGIQVEVSLGYDLTYFLPISRKPAMELIARYRTQSGLY